MLYDSFGVFGNHIDNNKIKQDVMLQEVICVNMLVNTRVF